MRWQAACFMLTTYLSLSLRLSVFAYDPFGCRGCAASCEAMLRIAGSGNQRRSPIYKLHATARRSLASHQAAQPQLVNQIFR
jgi:hypothetical protein